MPSRLKRYYSVKELHFITCSCYRRRPLLGSARRRDLFLRVLEQTQQRYQFVVVGYVVMPEHIHLLISEPEKADASVVMKVVKQRFARLVRKKRKAGCPSIRAKSLSRQTSPERCLTTAMFAREVEDQDSGNLTVNHAAVEPFVPPTIDSV